MPETRYSSSHIAVAVQACSIDLFKLAKMKLLAKTVSGGECVMHRHTNFDRNTIFRTDPGNDQWIGSTTSMVINSRKSLQETIQAVKGQETTNKDVD